MTVETDADRLASYFDAGEFGTTATVGGLPDVAGMFTNDYANPEFGGIGSDSTEPQFICNTADITGVTRGATVTVNATGYKIRSIESDSGISTLILRKTA